MSSLKRAKFYFFVIACLTTTMLFIYTYKWNISERIYRISTNHETHVHIESIPVNGLALSDKLFSRTHGRMRESSEEKESAHAISTNNVLNYSVPTKPKHDYEEKRPIKAIENQPVNNNYSNQTKKAFNTNEVYVNENLKVKQGTPNHHELSISEHDFKSISSTSETTATTPLYVTGSTKKSSSLRRDDYITNTNISTSDIIKNISKNDNDNESTENLTNEKNEIESILIEIQNQSITDIDKSSAKEKKTGSAKQNMYMSVDETYTNTFPEKHTLTTSKNNKADILENNETNEYKLKAPTDNIEARTPLKDGFSNDQISDTIKVTLDNHDNTNSSMDINTSKHAQSNEHIHTASAPSLSNIDTTNKTNNTLPDDKANKAKDINTKEAELNETNKELARIKILKLKDAVTGVKRLEFAHEEPQLNNYRARLEKQARDRIKSRLRKIGVSGNVFDQLNQFGKTNTKPDIANTHSLPLSTITVRPDNCRNCFRTDFKLLINAPNLCEEEVDILILISSAPANIDSRNAIRQTWGGVCNKPNSSIKCVFLFGSPNNSDINTLLAAESEQYHDVVQYDFHDSYANLTYKTMTGLRWTLERCNDAKYIMKTDDDMYVNTELLPIMLKSAPTKRLMGGFCWGPSSPHRDISSKWYVPFEQYTRPFFPKMCSGTGYVMSQDVVSGVLNTSADIPFFYLEDVYVALCLNRMGVMPVTLTGFSNSLVDFDACSYRNNVITSHSLSANSLEYIWKEIQTCPKNDLSSKMLYFLRPY